MIELRREQGFEDDVLREKHGIKAARRKWNVFFGTSPSREMKRGDDKRSYAGDDAALECCSIAGVCRDRSNAGGWMR